jgi:60 kDa SS-A/Ro ribonucleoprotein
MTVNYAKIFKGDESARQYNVPATKAMPNQIANNGGGYSYEVSKWDRLLRFLILGTEGGSYYQSESVLTKENAQGILECIAEDANKTFETVFDVFSKNRAPKDNTVLFALALLCTIENSAKRKAMASISTFCTNGTKLFILCGYLKTLSGWGRSLKRSIAAFYAEKNEEQLVYQILKYRSREGWTHKDVLRLTHLRPGGFQNDVFAFVCANEEKLAQNNFKNKMIRDYVALSQDRSEKLAIEFIKKYKASWEMLPTELLNNASIWKELVYSTPLTALIRNLNRLTKLELLTEGSDIESYVIKQLTDVEKLKKAKIHPFNMLKYWKTYSSGKGFEGKGSWEANSKIVAAMEQAYYLSFSVVEKTDKKIFIAIDCSDSMTWSSSNIKGTNISSREGAAAMAMTVVKTENIENVIVKGFSRDLVDLNLTKNMSLNEVMEAMRRVHASSTNFSAPVEYALKHKIFVDAFVAYTDNEVNCGINPTAIFKEYRDKINPKAKLIVVAFTAGKFTVANPEDRGMLDMVGFDSSAPDIMREFILGNI